MVNNARGFTLIEFLIVGAIVGIVAAIVVPYIVNPPPNHQKGYVYVYDSQGAVIIQSTIKGRLIESRMPDEVTIIKWTDNNDNNHTQILGSCIVFHISRNPIIINDGKIDLHLSPMFEQ